MACNNKTVEVVVNRNPSAFSRHQEQAATAEREIQVGSVLKYDHAIVVFGVLSLFSMNQSHIFTL